MFEVDVTYWHCPEAEDAVLDATVSGWKGGAYEGMRRHQVVIESSEPGAGVEAVREDGQLVPLQSLAPDVLQLLERELERCDEYSAACGAEWNGFVRSHGVGRV